MREKQIHQSGGQQDDDGGQNVNLDLADEFVAEDLGPHGAVTGNSLLAAEKDDEDDRAGSDQLADAKRNHGEDGPRTPGREAADDDRENQAEQPAKQRQERQRNEPAVIVDTVHDMHGEEPAEPEIDSMAEGQHAALAKQHVVAEREQDRDAHLVQDRDRDR